MKKFDHGWRAEFGESGDKEKLMEESLTIFQEIRTVYDHSLTLEHFKY